MVLDGVSGVTRREYSLVCPLSILVGGRSSTAGGKGKRASLGELLRKSRLFTEGLAGGVGLAAFLNLGGQWRLAGGGGQVDGLLGGDDGFGETAGGSIRGGQRVQRAGMVGVGEIDGVGGETKGFGGIAEFFVGLRGEEPGEVVEGFEPVGLEARGFAEVGDGVGGLLATGEEGAELIMGLGKAGQGLRGGGVGGDRLGGFAQDEENVAEVVLRVGVTGLEPDGFGNLSVRLGEFALLGEGL